MAEEQSNPPVAEEAGEAKLQELKREPQHGLHQTSGEGNIGVTTQGANSPVQIHKHGLDYPELKEILEKHEQKVQQDIEQRFERFGQPFKEAKKELYGEAEKEESPNASPNQEKVPRRLARFENKLYEDISLTEDKDDSALKGTDLPQSDADLAKWYYKLNVYDKCFVQAMAIFDGASIPAISEATLSLYEPVQQAIVATVASQSSSSVRVAMPEDEALDERLTRTYTKKHRTARGSQCLWKDGDVHTPSQFKLRVLHFIAEEVHMWHGSVFLESLQIWAESLSGENGLRAIYALGAVWWHQRDRLQTIANIWTRDAKWYRAAYLLDGAYEADRMAYGKKADDPNKSPVLWLVQKWIQEARSSGNVNRGCAAALTYALIGERSPTFALRGLDSLLELPPGNPESHKEPEGIAEDIYEAVVISYVTLAIYGSLQEVLQHLAGCLEPLSHNRLQLTEMKLYQRAHHRLQRKIKLIALLDVFARIASYSFETADENAKNGQWVNYNLDKPLPSSISLANNDGREILLLGILTRNSWRSHISILLCAALVEKLGDFAFELLWHWADIVLKDQGPSPDRVRKAYVEFVVELGMMLQSWSDHLVALGFPIPPAISTFKRKLEKWQREGQQRQQPIGILAQEILAQVPF